MEPRSDIERLLLEMQDGGLAPELFAKQLLDQQVFMPVKDDKHAIKGFQTSTQATPLVLEDEEGTQVLILFSTPERAKGFLAEFPDYHGGVLTEFSWVLRRMAEGLGISLNPGDDLGYDFDTDMVAMLATLLPEAAE
jgi:SseB protein N-terminal domain